MGVVAVDVARVVGLVGDGVDVGKVIQRIGEVLTVVVGLGAGDHDVDDRRVAKLLAHDVRALLHLHLRWQVFGHVGVDIDVHGEETTHDGDGHEGKEDRAVKAHDERRDTLHRTHLFAKGLAPSIA